MELDELKDCSYKPSKMTREEEIHEAAEEFAFSDKTETLDYRNAMNDFYYSAKWADEHPNLYNDEKYHTVKVSCLNELVRNTVLYEEFLEKACEYLRTHLWQNVDDDNDPIAESIHNITLDDFIKDFKRYLEE